MEKEAGTKLRGEFRQAKAGPGYFYTHGVLWQREGKFSLSNVNEVFQLVKMMIFFFEGNLL